MFERPPHRAIATLLSRLDARALEDASCWFGGGTAISLLRGEFRESLDVDFRVSDRTGYRELRQMLSTPEGMKPVLAGAEVVQKTDVRADQYGIRTRLGVGDVEVRFEIVLEARVDLVRPPPDSRVCGIATLTELDLATSQLLANADRFADDSTFSRDLIDLAMLDLDAATLAAAVGKATGAYGASVDRDLAQAIEALGARRGRLDTCMRALKMLPAQPGIRAVPPAVLWSRIRRLAHIAAPRRA